ncbi:hypothetical protein AM496_05885 [Helicobacter pylori]|uniref:Cag pathogenicity island protein n=1 Tax=Helicobacter pylori TaxID=210 RepID=A0ABD4B4N5_HELPX|nr:hypothetical protein AM496_05885 [Helicobacter pylori]
MKNSPLQPTTKNPLKSTFLRDHRLLFARFFNCKKCFEYFLNKMRNKIKFFECFLRIRLNF